LAVDEVISTINRLTFLVHPVDSRTVLRLACTEPDYLKICRLFSFNVAFKNFTKIYIQLRISGA